MSPLAVGLIQVIVKDVENWARYSQIFNTLFTNPPVRLAAKNVEYTA